MRRNRRHRPVNRYRRIKRIRWFRVIIAIILMALIFKGAINGLKYLIDKIPDSIIIDVKTEIEEERIRDIIREEIHQYDLEQKKQSKLKESTVQAKTQEQSAPEVVQSKEVASTVQVTSRGGVSRTETSKQSTSNNLGTYRLTHYYPGDGMASSNKTGSGLTTASFQTKTINGAQVYTYKGKIVLAAWTKELKKTGYNVGGAQTKDTYTFKYHQNVQIKIAGIWYDAIILDSCGAAGWKSKGNLVDIFVPSAGNSPATSCEIRI